MNDHKNDPLDEMLLAEQARLDALTERGAVELLLMALRSLAEQEAQRLGLPYLDRTDHALDRGWSRTLSAASDVALVSGLSRPVAELWDFDPPDGLISEGAVMCRACGEIHEDATELVEALEGELRVKRALITRARRELAKIQHAAYQAGAEL